VARAGCFRLLRGRVARVCVLRERGGRHDVTEADRADARELADPAAGICVSGGLLDALVVKLCDGQASETTACYLMIGVDADGEHDVLGLWIEKTESARFWLAVLTRSSSAA
jgi:Transposase, Mutator family